jgi:hypothetical protein
MSLKNLQAFVLVALTVLCSGLLHAQTYHTANLGVLISNTDANAQSGYGTYDLQTGNGTNNTNYPSGFYPYGNLINFNSVSFRSQLIITNTAASDLYFRSYYNSTYTPWMHVWTSGNFNPSNYVPISGGSLTGAVSVNIGANNSSLRPFTINSPDGHSALVTSSAGAGNWNNLVQAGDQALIYSGGTMGTGSFCIAPWANATSGIRLLSDGSVGIATADTKGYTLAVNGTGIMTKLIVKSYGNWPDYVFDSSYQLQSLSEVSNFIDKNHHLPGIEPAAQIEDSGLDIGANQAKLLAKIEELTLYLIELKKENEALKDKVDMISQQMTNNDQSNKTKK